MPFRRRAQPTGEPIGEASVEAIVAEMAASAAEAIAVQFNETVSDVAKSFSGAPLAPMSADRGASKISLTLDTSTVVAIGVGLILLASLVVNIVAVTCLFISSRRTASSSPSSPTVQYLIAPPAAPMGEAVSPGVPASHKDAAETIRRYATTATRRRPNSELSTPTTEEAVEMHAARHAEVKAKSARDILSDLKAGNARFWTGQSTRPDFGLIERRALINGQARAAPRAGARGPCAQHVVCALTRRPRARLPSTGAQGDGARLLGLARTNRDRV